MACIQLQSSALQRQHLMALPNAGGFFSLFTTVVVQLMKTYSPDAAQMETAEYFNSGGPSDPPSPQTRASSVSALRAQSAHASRPPSS